jgi:hypothetical protein
MIHSQYRYALILSKEDGHVLGQAPVEADWEPAKEYARFEGIRRGHLAADAGELDATVEPVWDAQAKRPFLSAVRVRLGNGVGRSGDGDGGGGRQAGAPGESVVESEVPTAYFRDLARLASAQLVERGELKAGERFLYNLTAYPCSEPPQPSQPGRFVIQPVCPPLPVAAGRGADFHAAAVAHGKGDPADVAVFIPQHVLEEVTELSRQAGALETGGVLIGHIRRDCGGPGRQGDGGGDLFLEITAQVPARGGRSELTRFTFTPDAWTSVAAAIELRRRGEIQLGWWHSHSYQKQTCKDCTKAADRSCKVSAAFLSEEDLRLCRNCFPRAYSLALVIAESPCSGLARELFGWRRGTIAHRGYHVLPGRPAQREDHEPLVLKGASHAGE